MSNRARDALINQYQHRLPVLPDPLAAAWDWQLQGLCRTAAIDFFPDHSESRRARDQQENAAKRLCQQCPVQRECLDYALTAGEPHGVWGGTTPRDRALMSVREPVGV